MPYEPPLYNAVPQRRKDRSGVTIALVVILASCLGCAIIGGIGGIFAMRSVAEVYPTIQAGIEGTLTATAGPPQAAANNRPPPSRPVTITARATSTPGPTSTPRPANTPTVVRPTSTPLPKPEVALQQVGYYRDTWDELWLMGELVNTGAIDAGDFRIDVELIGAQGQVVARGRADATDIGVVVLKPGQKTVWQIKTPHAPRQWQTERIEATTGPVLIGRGQSPYLDLRAERVQFEVGPGPFNQVTASGQVRNGGLATVRYARVKAAVYDDAGKLIRVVEGWPKFDAVPTGETAAFTVDFPDLEDAPAHVELYFTDLR